MDCFLIGALVSTAAVAIHPIELDDVISNPGMGWQSFYTTKNNDPNNAGIPSQAAYIRYYWSTLEPTRGNFNFGALKRNLAAARASGQKMMIRVMSYGHDGSGPAWLRNLGAHGHWFSFEGGPMQWAPDPEDPVVQAEHFRLLRALGRRYDGDPDVDAIDIGSIGLWGEWHNWHTSPVVPMPSTATAHRYIDQYFNDFPTTPKIGPVGVTDYPQGAENPGDYAVSRGAGWRGDALGDPSNMAMYPSHVNDFLTAAGATDVWKDAWKTAPVAFEMFGDLRKWAGSTARIVDYALANHASYVNNKSTPIPAGARPEIERLLKKLGYRLVLRGLEHPAAVTAGQPLALVMDWENVGVAPSYRNDVLAVQLRDASGSPVLTADTGIAVKAWLPGSVYHVTPTVTLPAGLAPGTYALAIGVVDPATRVVDPATRKPVVQLAIRGRDANGWYPLSTVSINGTNYQLVWNDEFNGTSVDASKWNEVGPWGQPVSSTGNFSYSPSNVSVSNGVATIVAQKSGDPWTGGILSTDTTEEFQYGFVEVRAKLPKGQGFWPAIWLYGGSSADELDVMEFLGGDATTVYQTYHFPGGSHQAQPSSPDWTNGYHLFQMKWEPGRITYYVDNVQMGSWTESVPSRPMYLMLNFDVGGPNAWGGAPDGSTPSSATFNVDYVRVYGSRLRHPRPRGPSHRFPGRAAK